MAERIHRRSFLKWSAAGTAVALLDANAGCSAGREAVGGAPEVPDIDPRALSTLGDGVRSGRVTSSELVAAALRRVRDLDGELHAIIALDESAPDEAAALDRAAAAGRLRGPLHGIPVLLKDNLDTAGPLATTAGSLALAGTRRDRDAFVVARLRAAGAVVLGKANLSEWANFRSLHSSSGWSAVGGQCRNPWVLDRSPCGSSSGSAAAVAAGMVPVALGTETDGSIVCPASACGVVGIKPTVGLTSRTGVVPIAHSQDTVGPLARSVADAARVLTAIAAPDPRDPATTVSGARRPADYAAFLANDGLKGARIGVPRRRLFGYSPEADAVVESALGLLSRAGAILVDPADLPSIDALAESQAELEVLLYEFKHDLNAYLAGLGPEAPVRDLAGLIAFNEAHADEELAWFGQELFHMAQEKGPLTEKAYLEAKAELRRLGGDEGLDAVLAKHDLDALVAPTTGPMWPIDLVNGDHFLGASSTPAAVTGYPLITVPAGLAAGLPVGLSFMGRAWSEPTLIRLAHGFERARGAFPGPGWKRTLLGGR